MPAAAKKEPEEYGPQYVISLEAENIKRIKAIRLIPTEPLTVIGGKNAQGKTSAIDCLAMAIGGKKAIPGEPIRRGASKGKILLKTTDLIVRLVITRKGSSLVVTGRETGTVLPSPQTLLDKLNGVLSFDPLAFSRMDQTTQLSTLKKVVGLDFTENEQERAKVYAARTTVGQEVKRLKVALGSSQRHKDAPTKLVVVSELMAKLDKQEEHNVENIEKRSKVTGLRSESVSLKSELEKIEQEQEALQRRYDHEQAQLADTHARTKVEIERVNKEGKKLTAEAKKLVDEDTEATREQIHTAEGANRKFRENEAHAETESEHEAAQSKYEKMSAKIVDLDEYKRTQIQKAKFPVEGLGFDEDGVTFEDIPFSQASSAQQLRVSLALGMALNPGLRVILIRDGSLLDDEGLRLVEKMAAESKCWVWLERVGKGKETSVVIEDGELLLRCEVCDGNGHDESGKDCTDCEGFGFVADEGETEGAA